MEEPSEGLMPTLVELIEVDDSDNPTSSEKNEENRSNDICACLCVWRKQVVFGTHLNS